jgi:hypothetical protein
MRVRLLVTALFLITLTAGRGLNAEPASPLLRMEFQVQEKDLGELIGILAQYAKEHGFSVKDIGPYLPKHGERTSPLLYVSLVREDSSMLVTNFIKQDQVLVAFYYKHRPLHADQIDDEPLISTLRERWPDIHLYTGP